MGEFQANLPGAHRYIAPTLAAAAGYVYSSKFLRSRPAKQFGTAQLRKLYKGSNVEPLLFPKKDMPKVQQRSKSRGRSKQRQTSSMRSKSMSLDTKVKNFARGRRHRGGSGTVSSGFFSRGRKVRRSSIDSMMRKGVVTVVETGGVETPSHCGYLGHCTMPTERVALQFWYAFFKKFITDNLRLSVSAPNSAISGLINGATFEILFYTDTFQTISSHAFVIGTNPVLPTIDALATEAHNWAVASWDESYTLLRMDFDRDSVGVDASVSLLGSKIAYRVKSTMKIQNRSAGADGTEADEVDNVPIYGKSYDAKGNGVIYANPLQSARLTGNDITGYIAYSGTANLNEPPPANAFDRPTRSNKAKLDPGQLKTSKLSENSKMDATKFLCEVYPLLRRPSHVKTYLGKSRIFAFEKMLETEIGVAIANMKIAYEINNRYEFSFQNGWTKTVPMFVEIS